MTVRASMAQIIATVRKRIGDSSDITQIFDDQDIQDQLDESRDDIRYEGLAIAPSIVNIAQTANTASTIFADYYSAYQWWEADVVLQGQGTTGLPWVVLTPAASDYIAGRWQFELTPFVNGTVPGQLPPVFAFELTPFVNGTVPGQLPPVFATGKVYDLYAASAELLEIWAARSTFVYDITVDGQTLRRSQIQAAQLQLAATYRRKAKMRVAKQVRRDVMPTLDSRRMRLLDSDDVVKGA